MIEVVGRLRKVALSIRQNRIGAWSILGELHGDHPTIAAGYRLLAVVGVVEPEHTEAAEESPSPSDGACGIVKRP